MLVEEIQENINRKIPFVVYQKPNQQEVFYVKEEKGSKTFLFSSFDQKQQFQIRYKEAIVVDWLKEDIKLELPQSVFPNDTIPKTVYKEQVQKVIDYIRDRKAEKIVFSHTILLEKKVNTFQTFKALLKNYPRAFCYLWFHPKTGVWIGATPETLIKTQGNNLKTMSLAGTKTLEQEWSVKEIQEQKIVSEYIKKQLEPFSKTITISEVQTVQSGMIQHLLTEISVVLKTKNYKQIIQKIHPTPAVCGVPTEKAKAYIQKYEKYNRLFYTGFLGELDNNYAELYVNLRCAQLNASQVKLYAGGGINALSDPEKEWQETLWKVQAIKKYLVFI
ncbi:MAG: isochorismate synthase [Flavobacteriales bacterium]